MYNCCRAKFGIPFFIYILIFANLGYASTFKGCQITPQAWSYYAPQKVEYRNNLLIKGDSMGEAISLRGQVLDSKCTPVEGAIVSIWYTPNSQSGELQWRSGKAVTNNLGQYQFITKMPGSYITIHVRHRLFEQFETKAYFSKSALNKEQKNLSEAMRKLLLAHKGSDKGNDFTFDVTLEGTSPYRR